MIIGDKVKNSIKTSVVLCLIIVLSFFVIVIYSYTELKNEKKETEKINNNFFAVLVQKDDGTYEKSNEFPSSGYVFDSEKSGCVDQFGNLISNSLSYNRINNVASVNIRTTARCYLYF